MGAKPSRPGSGPTSHTASSVVESYSTGLGLRTHPLPRTVLTVFHGAEWLNQSNCIVGVDPGTTTPPRSPGLIEPYRPA